MPRVETRKLVEKVTVGQAAGHVGHDRRVERLELDLDHAPFSVPSDVERCVDQLAMEPGVEQVGVT